MRMANFDPSKELIALKELLLSLLGLIAKSEAQGRARQRATSPGRTLDLKRQGAVRRAANYQRKDDGRQSHRRS